MSDSLWPHWLQHARPPCPSPTPRVYSNSCPLSQWCHPTISSSVVPFTSSLQSFPASGSFQMSQLFASGGQSIGASALASILPVNTQDWSPLGWTGWIPLQSKRLSRVFSSTTVWNHSLNASVLWRSAFFMVQFSHAYMATGKTIALTTQTLLAKWCVCFLACCMLVTAFLLRSKHLSISWLQSPSTMILEPKKIKSLTVTIFSPIYLPWSDGTRCHDLSFLNIRF